MTEASSFHSSVACPVFCRRSLGRNYRLSVGVCVGGLILLVLLLVLALATNLSLRRKTGIFATTLAVAVAVVAVAVAVASLVGRGFVVPVTRAPSLLFSAIVVVIVVALVVVAVCREDGLHQDGSGVALARALCVDAQAATPVVTVVVGELGVAIPHLDLDLVLDLQRLLRLL